MFTRKLVKSGLSSNVIALPKEYLDDNKLKTGDTVYLERQGKAQIIISAGVNHREAEELPRVKTIDTARRPMRHVERDIIEAYLKNYSEIIIELQSPSDAREVKKYISYLVALEVVQEDNKRIIARDFLSYKDRDIERTLRRVEHIIGSMLADVKDCIGDAALAEAVNERDYEVNRIGFLIMRILQVASIDPEVARLLKVDTLGIIRLWTMNVHLEKIGDEAKRVATKLAGLQSRQQKRKLLELWDEIVRLYHSTFAAIHSGNSKVIDTNLDKRNALLDAMDEYAHTKEAQDIPEVAIHLKQIVAHLGDINRVQRYVGE